MEVRRHVLGEGRWGSSPSRSTSGSTPKTIFRAGLGFTRRPITFYVLERRAARHLDHRAVEQVAPAVARSPRPRDAALRDQQAAPGALARRSGPPRGRASGSRPRRRPSGRTVDGSPSLTSPRGKTWSSRRRATPSSASATWRSGPRCWQILKDISANRMPSVADLLKDAAQARRPSRRQRPRSPRRARLRRPARSSRPGGKGKPRRGSPPELTKQAPKPNVPTVVDRESRSSLAEQEGEQGRPPAAKKNPVRSPEADGSPTDDPRSAPGPPNPAASPSRRRRALEEAVRQQQDLLAEFEKIADELNKVLANLEGSTLVKRLKAASRAQYEDRRPDQRRPLGSTASASTAGRMSSPKPAQGPRPRWPSRRRRAVTRGLDDHGRHASPTSSAGGSCPVQDRAGRDAQGRTSSASLRQLGDDLKSRVRASRSPSAEFWSDTLDRWAEDLVDPTCKSWLRAPAASRRTACRRRSSWKSSRSSKARSTSARRPASTQQAKPRPCGQGGLRHAKPSNSPRLKKRYRNPRSSKVTDSDHRDLPDSEKANFGYEINLLGQGRRR